ncbi:MAG: hypothetical protein GW938_07430 [Leptospira sp.]|nr:hypothetical protein [Leptospira sp.]
MKKSIILFILSLFLILSSSVNCLTTPKPTEKLVTPNFTNGCSEYKGSNRTKCIQELLTELEYLRDPKNPIAKTVVETRYDSYWVLVETEYCPSKNFCWLDPQYVYKPSLYIKIRDYSIVGLMGLVFGYSLGIP